jgi:predicted nucleotidyltransferase
MTRTFDDLKNAIVAARSEIEARYPIRLIGIFGSAARNERRLDSDVDILVESRPGLSLTKLGAVTLALESAIGCPVDLVFESSLSPRARSRVVSELRTL